MAPAGSSRFSKTLTIFMYLANQVVEIIDFFIIFLNYIISTWLGGSKRHTTHLGIVGSINNLDININNEIKMNYDDDDDVCDYNHADDDDVDQEGVNLSSSGH